MGRARHVIWLIQLVYEPILSSMLAAGIVQDTFAGEAGEGERGRRSRDDWRLLLPPGRKFFPFLNPLVLTLRKPGHLENGRQRNGTGSLFTRCCGPCFWPRPARLDAHASQVLMAADAPWRARPCMLRPYVLRTYLGSANPS